MEKDKIDTFGGACLLTAHVMQKAKEQDISDDRAIALNNLNGLFYIGEQLEIHNKAQIKNAALTSMILEELQKISQTLSHINFNLPAKED